MELKLNLPLKVVQHLFFTALEVLLKLRQSRKCRTLGLWATKMCLKSILQFYEHALYSQTYVDLYQQ